MNDTSVPPPPPPPLRPPAPPPAPDIALLLRHLPDRDIPWTLKIDGRIIAVTPSQMADALEARRTSPAPGGVHNHGADVEFGPGIECHEHLIGICRLEALTTTVAEDAASFQLRWDADMRAIARWQAAHPDKPDTWPDHADLVVWLMEQLDEAPSSTQPSTDDLLAQGPQPDDRGDAERPLDRDPLPSVLDAAGVAEWLDSREGRIEDIFALWTQGKRTSLWAAERLIDEGHLAALSAPVAAGEGLREALAELEHETVSFGKPDTDLWAVGVRHAVTRIRAALEASPPAPPDAEEVTVRKYEQDGVLHTDYNQPAPPDAVTP